jgi:hypothetical protein
MKPVPQEAYDSYLRLRGNDDLAQYSKVDTSYWGEIEYLLMHVTIVDAGHAAESYRQEFLSALAKSGLSLDALRHAKKVVDEADAERKNRLSLPLKPWWKFWK